MRATATEDRRQGTADGSTESRPATPCAPPPAVLRPPSPVVLSAGARREILRHWADDLAREVRVRVAQLKLIAGAGPMAAAAINFLDDARVSLTGAIRYGGFETTNPQKGETR